MNIMKLHNYSTSSTEIHFVDGITMMKRLELNLNYHTFFDLGSYFSFQTSFQLVLRYASSLNIHYKSLIFNILWSSEDIF